MAVKDIKNKLATTLANNKSNWQTKAEWRQANESWLRHSRQIALKINKALKAQGLTQKQLAERLAVSPQQVSKLLKGTENMTLETIAKLESTLDVALIGENVYAEADTLTWNEQVLNEPVESYEQTK